MKKIDAARLAGGLAGFSTQNLGPVKGLKFYRLWQELKAIQKEIGEYEQKIREDYGVKTEGNDPETIKAVNKALALMFDEEAIIKAEPFLTEEEFYGAVEGQLTFEGIELLMPIVCNH